MPSHRQELEAFLWINDSIKYIRIEWTDYSGVLHARFIPVARCLEIASDSEIIHLAQNKECPQRFDKCPHMLLFQSLKRLEAGWDAKVLVGFEIELVLLDGSDNVLHPIVRLNGYSRTAGLRGETLKLVEEIAEALEESCIKIHRFHTDVQGKLEIALAPEPALEAVDSLVLAQEAIRAICVRRNLKAAMTPKPTLSGPSSGLHLHLSISKLEQALVDHSLAGVLSHMGALCAFGMANHDSYVRPTGNAAGAWIGFGTDNRDLPVRKISDQHWEFRMMDSTANPYLFTAATLLAGLDALEHKTELIWKDCKFFPHLMDRTLRVKYGLERRMPATFREALECLKMNAGVENWIPEVLLEWLISVKDKDAEEFEKMIDEQRRLRFVEYF